MEKTVISGARSGAKHLARQEQRFLVYATLLIVCAVVATFLGPRAGVWSFLQVAGVTELTNWFAVSVLSGTGGP